MVPGKALNCAPREEPASYQLVGGVKAYQGHGQYTYGWQQLGILRNGGNPDAATPRGGRRSMDRKLLLPSRSQLGE
ncbi:MAG: hypothetical protein UU52_C0023G0011 [Candidatus Levybacteria bacterium GW2011_GWB1_41_21]|nr:MAG: hypothetical protein UU52_C0023G0011 [Candidatus Levybacteria bacterium GW2011_GWB1_41_21]